MALAAAVSGLAAGGASGGPCGRLVEQFDVSDLTSDNSRSGKRIHHPLKLLALLFYGYSTGVLLSRKLERTTYEAVAIRFIAANLNPDHDTTVAFRRRFIGRLDAQLEPATNRTSVSYALCKRTRAENWEIGKGILLRHIRVSWPVG